MLISVGRLRSVLAAGGVALGAAIVGGCGTGEIASDAPIAVPDATESETSVSTSSPVPDVAPSVTSASTPPIADIVTLPAVIGGVVWWDVDADGVRDPEEPPPPLPIGVDVHMVDPSSPDGYVQVRVRTDESGAYELADAPVGELTVTADLDGWTTPRERVVTTTAGEVSAVDFGAHFGTTSGFAFFDDDGDGVFDEFDGESPADGLEVSFGNLSAVTGTDGGYSLAGLTGQEGAGLRYTWRGNQVYSPVPAPAFRSEPSPRVEVGGLDWSGKPGDVTPGVQEVDVFAWFGDRSCWRDSQWVPGLDQCVIPDTADIDVALIAPTFDATIEARTANLTATVGSELRIAADVGVSGGPFVATVLSADLTAPLAIEVRALPLAPGRWWFHGGAGSPPTSSPPPSEPPTYHLRPMCSPDEEGSTMRTCGPLEGSLDPIEMFLVAREAGTYRVEIALPTSIGTGLVDRDPGNNSVVITVDVRDRLPGTS